MMKRHSLLLGMAAILAGVVIVPGCAREAGEKKTTEQSAHMEQMARLDEKRDSTMAAIKAMNLQSLVARMEEDARAGREPFNSNAYREITRSRQREGDALLQAVRALNPPSYLSLLALRAVNPDGYRSLGPQVAASVLVAELGRTKYYNKWGLPHLYWEAAAKAVIEAGEAATPGLIALLGDRSPAPVWGEEEVAEYEAYQYRRCDYALALLMAIRGRDVKQLPRTQAERDVLIREMMERK